jgi:UDP-N-acetylmuramyl pentapeptide synthase
MSPSSRRSRPVHLEFFGSVERRSRRPRRRSFSGLEPGGTALLNRDNDQFDLLTFLPNRRRPAIIAHVRRDPTAGRAGSSDFPRRKAAPACKPRSSTRITYKIGAPVSIMVKNSLAVLDRVAELGRRILRWRDWRWRIACAPKGRGARQALKRPDGIV